MTTVYFAYYKWAIKIIKYLLFLSDTYFIKKNDNKDNQSNYRNVIFHYSAHEQFTDLNTAVQKYDLDEMSYTFFLLK